MDSPSSPFGDYESLKKHLKSILDDKVRTMCRTFPSLVWSYARAIHTSLLIPPSPFIPVPHHTELHIYERGRGSHQPVTIPRAQPAARSRLLCALCWPPGKESTRVEGQNKERGLGPRKPAATLPPAHDTRLHKSLGMLGDASGTEPARVSTDGLSSQVFAPRWQQNKVMK